MKTLKFYHKINKYNFAAITYLDPQDQKWKFQDLGPVTYWCTNRLTYFESTNEPWLPRSNNKFRELINTNLV